MHFVVFPSYIHNHESDCILYLLTTTMGQDLTGSQQRMDVKKRRSRLFIERVFCASHIVPPFTSALVQHLFAVLFRYSHPKKTQPATRHHDHVFSSKFKNDCDDRTMLDSGWKIENRVQPNALG